MKEETPITVKLDWIQKDISDIKKKLEKDYVTEQEFKPVKNVVYGMTATILLAVIGTILTFVLK